MDLIDQAVLCACLREVRKDIYRLSLKGLANRVAARGGVSQKLAYQFLCRQGREDAGGVAAAALAFANDQREAILRYFHDRKPAFAQYLSILLRDSSPSTDSSTGLPDVLGNWCRSAFDDNSNDVFRTGVYQMFRRHKPFRPRISPMPLGEPVIAPVADYEDPQNHAVVTELAFVNTTSKICILVDGSGQVYYGSLHINAERTAFLLLQRQEVSKSFTHRFYCLKLEGRATLYPLLSMRIGEVSKKPIASECFALYLSRKEHSAVYAAFTALQREAPLGGMIDDASVIVEYLAPVPPHEAQAAGGPKWSNVRYIRDFPFLAQLVKFQYDGTTPFQEPLRTLGKEDITSLLHSLRISPLSTFRRSD